MFFDCCPDPIFNYNTKLNCSFGCFAGGDHTSQAEELPYTEVLGGNVYLINPTDTYSAIWSVTSFPTDCEPTFDDNTKLTPTVTFPCVGEYSFQLDITDSNNNASQCTVTITVESENPPPPCDGEIPDLTCCGAQTGWCHDITTLPYTNSGDNTTGFTAGLNDQYTSNGTLLSLTMTEASCNWTGLPVFVGNFTATMEVRSTHPGGAAGWDHATGFTYVDENNERWLDFEIETFSADGITSTHKASFSGGCDSLDNGDYCNLSNCAGLYQNPDIADFDETTWNTFKLSRSGTEFNLYVNDVLAFTYDPGTATRGRLCLSTFAVDANPLDYPILTEIRNISIT